MLKTKITTNSLVIQLDDLVAVLLEAVEVLNLILVALHCLGVCLLQVHILNGIKLPFVIKDLIHLQITHNS